jgi:hypothetical protein
MNIWYVLCSKPRERYVGEMNDRLTVDAKRKPRGKVRETLLSERG